MKTRRKIYISASIALLAMVIFSVTVFARGNSGGDGNINWGQCGETTANACTEYITDETTGAIIGGGYSWRYYKTTSDSVTFNGFTGTGGNVTVEECGQVGGFYFLGFEAYGKDGKYLGYQVPKINLKEARRISHWAEVSKANSGHGNPQGSPTIPNDEVRDRYNEARAIMEKELGGNSQKFKDKWKPWGSADNLIWFCAKPENAAYAAKSSVSIDGGSSTETTWSSSNNRANPARRHIPHESTATITFVHHLKKDGTGVIEGGTQYSVTGAAPGKTGSFNKIDPEEVYRRDVQASSTGTYCSTITYDNKAKANHNENTTSTVCAEITVNPPDDPPPEELEEVQVLFSANSKVEANGDFDVINENTGETYTIHQGEVLGVSGGATDSLTNTLNPEVLTVVDDWIPLKFSHVVTRIDGQGSKVNKAYTHTVLTPPSLTLSLNNVGSVVKNIFFSSSQFVQKLKQAFGDKNSFASKLDLGFAKDRLSEISGDTANVISNSTYLPSALKLRTEELRVNESDGDYTTSAKYKAGDDQGRDYCQALLYQNVRTVYTDESMNKIKENTGGISTGIPWLDKILNWCKNLVMVLANIINKDDDGTKAALEDLKQSTTVIAQSLVNDLGYFIELLSNNQAPVSAVCVRLKKAFNFSIDANPRVVEDIAIVGESLTLNANDSTIISEPLHGDILTNTSPLEVQVISFSTKSTNSDAFKGNYVSRTPRSERISPCDYYRNKASTSDCNLIKTAENITIDRNADNRAEVSLNQLGISSNLSATVPDVETGTLFCLAIGVKDADSDSKRNGSEFWAVSNATCRTVAKKPSLQVHDGSVYSAGKVETLLTNKIPSSGGGSKTLYGSWVEYGLIGKNAITGLASGAQLRNGSSKSKICDDSANPFTTLSPLTIANKDCTLGKSEIAVNPNILQRFRTVFTDLAKSKTPATETPIAIGDSSDGQPVIKNLLGAVSVSGTAVVPHIIYSPESITITSNITSNNINAPVILISDKDIIINNNVTQVDAWLVAAGGNIKTCSDLNVGNFSDESSSCGNRLSINGPVFAKGLKPYRAAGSGVGHNNSLVPAETFTLPASTYVWAYNYASSDKFYPAYQRELAPRY